MSYTARTDERIEAKLAPFKTASLEELDQAQRAVSWETNKGLVPYKELERILGKEVELPTVKHKKQD